MSEGKLTYKEAGVDIDRARAAHSEIGRLVKKTFELRKGKFGKVLGERSPHSTGDR